MHAAQEASTFEEMENYIITLLSNDDLSPFIQALDNKKVNCDFVNESGFSLLHYAVVYNPHAIPVLAKYGARISANNGMYSPLLTATLVRSLPAIENLLTTFPEQKLQLDVSNGPLHIALRHQNRLFAGKLLKYIDNVAEKYNYSPLHSAIDEYDLAKVQVFLSREPELINQPDKFGYTPLHLAVLNKEPVLVTMLLAGGADANVPLPTGQTVYTLANQLASPELLAALSVNDHLSSKLLIDPELPLITTAALTKLLMEKWNEEQAFTNKLYLKDLLEQAGYMPILKGIDFAPFDFYLHYLNLKDLTFINCHFSNELKGKTIQAYFEHCHFQGFSATNMEFAPGTIINNSTFQDSVFYNVNFNDATLSNNYFFYTVAEDSHWQQGQFTDNYFYGSQFWNVELNVAPVNLQLVESDVREVSSMLPLEYTLTSMPVVGVLGNVPEISDFSKPGFLAAEPYLRIKQAGALPYLISEKNILKWPFTRDLDQEIGQQLANVDAKLSDQSIVQFVLQADLPHIKQLNSFALDYAQKLDGLWIPGGPDIHPAFYGKAIPEGDFSFGYERDIFEFALVHHMLALNKPILGICHGAQLVNVYFGGTLLQDVPGHMGVVQPVNVVTHEGILGSAFEGDMVVGLSAHHQAIDTLAVPLAKVAEYDSVVKAVQGIDQPLYLSQFHPEYLLDDNNSNMLKKFFTATKERHQLTLDLELVNEPIVIEEVLTDTWLASSTFLSVVPAALSYFNYLFPSEQTEVVVF